MPLDPLRYSVVWFAPLEIEARAAACMLDHRHDGYFALGPADDYVFQAGDICGYNVIIASFPAGKEYGTSAAAALASQVKTFFPNVYLGLLVGVAAGLPDLTQQPERDIRLGDVLVALSVDDQPAVIAYDLGKQRADDDFSLLRSGYVLSNTKTVLRSAIGTLKAEEPHSTKSFLPYYHAIQHMQHATGTFVDPGQEGDHYVMDRQPVQRKTRPRSQRTRVWYGAIGSGDTLMRDARRRNELQRKYGILGLEMEAAGIMNHIPVAVIRGVCDYGDEYKNKEWQPFAAAMAAAYAKAVLQRIPPRHGSGIPSPKGSSNIISGQVRNGIEVLHAFGQTTFSYLIQRAGASHTTDWKYPLIGILRRYLRTAMSIPRGLSSSIVICDFLGRDLHLELPIDWYDLRVILLPHFDTPQRHGFEKIRKEEFLIMYCDQSEKSFKWIGPSDWDAEAQHGRKFQMFAIINQLQLKFQVCTACQARMKKFCTYLVCPNCGLFGLSALHQSGNLLTEASPSIEQVLHSWLSNPQLYRSISNLQLDRHITGNSWTQHPVGILSSLESVNRTNEIHTVAPVGAWIGKSGCVTPTWCSEGGHPGYALSEAVRHSQDQLRDVLSYAQIQKLKKQCPQFQCTPTDCGRKNQSFDLGETRHFRKVFIKEDTVLYDAASKGDMESVKSILARLQASQISVDATWGPLGAPLVATIIHRPDSSDSVIEALLRAGADPLLNFSTPVGSPLCIAATLGDTNAVEIMLGFILDSVNINSDADINHLQGVLDESLFRATLLGHYKLVPLLLYAGANPFAATEPQRSAFAIVTGLGPLDSKDSGYAIEFVAEGYGRGLITSDEARLLIDAVYRRHVPVDGTPDWLDACCRSISTGKTALLEERVARRLASSTRQCFLSWIPFWRQRPSGVRRRSCEVERADQ